MCPAIQKELEERRSVGLTPEAVAYLFDKVMTSIRNSLAQNPEQIEGLRKCRRDGQRKITRLVEAVKDGQAPQSFVDAANKLEAELHRLDNEIEELERRSRLSQIDVERELRKIEPVVAAWKEILRGNPVRARQILRKLIVGPIRMQPMENEQGYEWKGKLNGGAVLEGSQKYLQDRAGIQNPHEFSLFSRFLSRRRGRRRRSSAPVPSRSGLTPNCAVIEPSTMTSVYKSSGS